MNTQPATTEPATPNERKTPGQVAYEQWCVEMDYTPYWTGTNNEAWERIAAKAVAHNERLTRG